jgi:tRNA pseudouridine13 synthase
MCRKVPEIDAAAGMTTYLTASRGIGGLMRQRPQDFIVDEVYADSSSREGRYQLVTVTKTDMETHHLVRDLSRRLRISQRRISWAGTKDKRAVTTQRMSLDSVRVDAPLTFRNALVEPVGRSDRPITLGDLDGNNFLVTIRAVGGSESDITRSVARVLDEMRGAHGVPNFFGIQRFGSIRPLNHLVGRALVEGDTERAVMTYLAKPFPDEPEDIREVRQFISDTYEFKEALKQMPVRLRYERAMLSHLVTCPNDFDGALGALSMNLQRLFVHALQSYLFNKMLSSRIERGFPLDEAFDGDRVWVADEGRLRTVVPKNLQEINQSLAARSAIVQMPVPGYDTELSDGVIGQIERDVLAAEHLDLDAFKIGSCPRLASKGIMRNVLLPADIQFSVSPDELNKHRAKVTMSFFLPKGGYATTILREVMKTRLL